ncbi:MAG TPA: DUF6443 domain-containing protein, partial [Chryseosolibacter sp.]|nr:DUF6443 domain-containing protein [Chryseosolibacter sp.]
MKKIFDRTEYNLSWARITMVIFMAFVTGLQSYGQEADRISGATQVCDGETESYRYTGSSGFKRWTIVGSYTLVGGTTVTSNPISIRWKSNGTLDVVPIAPPPADFGISVTLHSKPTVRISGPVEGRPGETVTMTASGASGYYWEGPGLQSTTGQTVSAILPDYDDFVYMVEGYQGYCSGTDSHFIKVLLVDAGPDRIYCRDAGSIDLNEWGLSLTEGQWSGPALTGNVIDLSALAPGEYIYRYTRKDGAHDSIILSVIESIGGSTSLNVFDNCGPLTGRITLSGHTGNITSWEKSYDDGQTWQSISSTANPFEYFENVGASFRAVVKYGTCTAARSERVTISPALANVGTISSSVEQDCNTISGSLALTGSDGLVHSWEKTYDNISWASVPDATANPLSGISENSFVGYRAVVQAGSCPVERTEPVFFEPLAAVGGFLQSTSLNITCESATGTLALQGAEGDSYEWKQSTDGVEWTTMAGVTGTTFNFDISVETQYQVVVRRGDCQPATSSIFTVHVSSQGGKATVTAANQCGTAKGNVVLSRWIGNIVKWQTSTNNTLWEDIPGSEDLTMLEFTTSAPVNYYRAVVQSGTCPEVYSTSAQVNVSSPTKPGIVRLVNDPDFELVSGAPVFKNVEFQLYDYHGNIQHWTGETNAGSTKYAIAAPALTLTIDKTTAVRAQVKSGVCDPLLSGQAIFVVNKKFQGILSLFGQRTPSGEVLGVPISEYTGYSYQVSGPGGVSLKEGFSFHANRAQNFFVLLDDNYAVPPPDQNSARDEVVLKEGIRDEQEIYFLNSKDRSSTYTYYDGLERPIQKVHRRISPNDRDLVVALGYDGFGRQVREYLPYEAASNDGGFQENAIAEQRAFYLAPPDGIASSEYPYAVTVYEQSPLNRVTERGSAGSEWQPEIGHTLKLRYETNFANEVINWKLSASGLPVRSGFYQAGTLVVDVKVNEQGNSSKEYKDKLGRVILKRVQNADEWLDTYCVYDEFNLKRFEIQPEGVAILGSSVDQAFLDQWAFQYRYNERRLQVAKRIPGAGWVFNVYDDRDRLVLSQDANQRTKNQWTFIKYDHLNRPVLNGLYTFRDPHDPDHIATPDEIRAKVSTTFFSEEYTGEAPFGYSINRVFPTEDIEVLTANYYDDYTFCTSVVFDGVPAYDKNALTGLPASAASLVKGMPTGNMVRILDSDKWL